MVFSRASETMGHHKSQVLQGFLGFVGLCEILNWWAHQDSNLGPSGYEPVALPTEL